MKTITLKVGKETADNIKKLMAKVKTDSVSNLFIMALAALDCLADEENEKKTNEAPEIQG